MDISSFPFALTTISLISSVFIFFLFSKKCNMSKKQASSVKLPPGPKKLPIIGNLHHISSLPFISFRDLSKQYGPIMHLTLGHVPTVVVSSPEIAKEMLKDNDPNYANRPETLAFEVMWYNYANIGFSPYGGYWRQMRKICISELLRPKNVRSFGSIRKDEVSLVVESFRLSSGRPVNFTETIFAMTNSITCRATCGKVCADRDALIELMQDALRLASGFEIADLFPSSKFFGALSFWGKRRMTRVRHRIDVILDGIIDEHKANLSRGSCSGEFGNEDLIDVFLRIKESGELEFPIGNDNIKAVILDMFAAGTDTSSSTIDWTMAELIKNPRIMEKAQAEVRRAFGGAKVIIEEHEVQKLKYLKLVIKESLRMHPPVPILPRASRDERIIGGYTIPAKTRVMVNNWAIQRDPEYWENPDVFEPERFESHGSPNFVGGDFQYLPFGAGKRMCPGMNFGVANVEMPLAQLLYSFDWKLPDGMKVEHLDMVETHGATCSRKGYLFLVATPYESFA